MSPSPLLLKWRPRPVVNTVNISRSQFLGDIIDFRNHVAQCHHLCHMESNMRVRSLKHTSQL